MARITEPNDLSNAILLRTRTHPALCGLDGGSIVICIIDYGFDLAHPAFRTDNGETIFVALIDQNGCRLERVADRSQNRDALDRLCAIHAPTMLAATAFRLAGMAIGLHQSHQVHARQNSAGCTEGDAYRRPTVGR